MLPRYPVTWKFSPSTSRPDKNQNTEEWKSWGTLSTKLITSEKKPDKETGESEGKEEEEEESEREGWEGENKGWENNLWY